jgi:hypothetical protein
VRVSVSGNYFLAMQTMLGVMPAETTSKVSEFSG